MPEGHSIRFLADAHLYGFQGLRVEVLSPQGRFAGEAAVINGTTLTDVTTHGKHMFLHFDNSHIVHVHLGLYGWFHFNRSGTAPAETTRMRLDSGLHVSDLRGPTICKLIDIDGKYDVVSRLGPDPLHDETVSEQVWARVSGSSKPIAELLMDQSVIAGIGNAFRAEILFIAKQHPYTRGCDVSRAAFENLWHLSVRCLQKGSDRGVICTVAPVDMSAAELAVAGPNIPATYVYGRAGQRCRVCSTPILLTPVLGRKLYWCPLCQR